jgi:hypothetical protein
VVHTDPEANARRFHMAVGRITRWGKVVGNHHLGAGPARRVDTLKGVNMAFRRTALALPRGLRGSGAEVHNEVAICSWASRRGWLLVYDPSILVDHFPAPRLDADRRGDPTPQSVENEAFNLVVSLLSERPRLFWRRAVYGTLIGDAGSPGLLRGAYAFASGDAATAPRVVPSLRGQFTALIWLARGSRLSWKVVPTHARTSYGDGSVEWRKGSE